MCGTDTYVSHKKNLIC